MGFIASAISAIIGFAGSFSFGGFNIGRALLGIGLSLGLSALSKMLQPKQKKNTSANGVQLSLQVGADVGRQIVFGITATKGHLAYFNTSGAANGTFSAAYLLSEGWCESLDAVWIGGVRKTLTQIADDTHGMKTYHIQGYGALAVVRFHDGRPGQTYDTALIAASSSRLVSTDRFAGICYVSVILTYNEDQFSGGPPEFSWEMHGYRCYDVRKDTTAGGSGTHRSTDSSTWEWTANPAIHAYNFLMGCEGEGVVMLGPNVPTYDLQTPSFIAAANICDETVTLEAGGTEPRYVCSAVVVGDDTDFRTLIEPLISAMAGYLLEYYGSFGILAGATQMPVTTIHDGDFRVGPEQRYSAKLSRTDRTNQVYGQFVDPAAGWQANSYPPILSADALSEDGEPLRVSLDLAAVPSVTQAQRIATARLRETRAQANGTFTLGSNYLTLDPGDWITWVSARYGWTKLFRIMTRQLNSDDSVTVAFNEVNNNVYAWSTSMEQPHDIPGAIPGDPGYITTVSSFTAEAYMITAESGAQRPAVRLRWTPVIDDTVDAVIIEYRQINTIAATRLRDDSPEDGEYIFDTVGAGDKYEFRATIATTPVRPTSWTLFVGVQTGASQVPPGSINFDSLGQSVRDAFTPVAKLRYLALDAIIDASQTWELETGNHVEDVNTSATFTQQIRLQVSATDALAEQLTTLEAQVGDDIQAQIANEAVARANADGALATEIDTVQASVNDVSASVSTVSTAVAGINGKLSATWTVTLDVDGFVSGIQLYNDGTTSLFQIKADVINLTALSDFNVDTGALNVSGDLNVGNKVFIRAGSNPRIEIYDA